MNDLRQLSPEECLFIMEGENVSFKELFKLCFLHLLLKEVVRVNIYEKTFPNQLIRNYVYVLQGKHFHDYKTPACAQVLIRVFEGKSGKEILIKHVIKLAYLNAQSMKYYGSLLLQTPLMAQCFHQTWWQKIRGRFSITDVGLQYREKIKDQVFHAEQQWQLFPTLDTLERIRLDMGVNALLLKDAAEKIFGVAKIILSELDKDVSEPRERSSAEGSVFYDSGL